MSAFGGATTIVMVGVTASGATPLRARTANQNDPVVLGIPASVPLVLSRLRPGGSTPLSIAKMSPVLRERGDPAARKNAVYGAYRRRFPEMNAR